MALRQPPQTSDAFFAQLLHIFLCTSLPIAGVLDSVVEGFLSGDDDAGSDPDKVDMAELKLILGDGEIANGFGSAGTGNPEDETGPNVKVGYVPVLPETSAVKGLAVACADANGASSPLSSLVTLCWESMVLA